MKNARIIFLSVLAAATMLSLMLTHIVSLFVGLSTLMFFLLLHSLELPEKERQLFN